MEIKIIRKIDNMGRIVIPKDVRTTLELRHDDVIEITVVNGAIVIKKVTVAMIVHPIWLMHGKR